MYPPWHQLDHPLVQFEIRRSQRTPNFGWIFVLVLFFGLITLDLALLSILASDQQVNRPFTGEVIPILSLTAGGTLSLYIILLYLRLLITLAARTARSIAGRRRRGDWELIAVSPIPRIRWLQAQLVGLGWQVFPLVRQMIIANCLLVSLFVGNLIYVHAQGAENNPYYEPRHISLLAHGLTISLIGLVAALFPLLEVPLYTAVGLFASSRSQRVTMSMLYTFFWIFVTRMVLAAALIYGAIMIFAGMAILMDGLGVLNNLDTVMLIERFDSQFYLGGLLTCIAIPISALLIEGLPVFPILMLNDNFEADVVAWFIISTILVGALVYIYLPMRLLPWFIRRTVKRLNHVEFGSDAS